MDPARTPFSRLFTIEDLAGPENVPVYQGFSKAGAPSWSLGDRTAIREPDPDRYGAFRIVDAIKGAKGLPSLPIVARYGYTVSEFLRMARRGCPLDLQVHFGRCQDPRDFNLGWDKILVLENADMSNWATGDMGALDEGEDAVIEENIDFNAFDMYEIKPLLFSEIAELEITGEVIDVVICDAVTCGECGLPSSGCQVWYSIAEGIVASPGLPAELNYSQDGGQTVGSTFVNTLAINEGPTGLACVGTRLAVISYDAGLNATCPLSYAPLLDILNGIELWTCVVAGFNVNGPPLAIFSLGSAHTWIVGGVLAGVLGGYIYFTDDITAGVVIQDAGIATVSPLHDVFAYDENNVIAVGEDNAIIVTTDGVNWAPAPNAPAVLATTTLTCCWMKTRTEWFVGDAVGQLWYTRDSGQNWTEKVFPGSGAGVVGAISFATPTVGYMAHSTIGPPTAGRVLRTIDGGHSWYVLPEGPTTIPVNLGINALASAAACPNVVYAGGLQTAGPLGDGILLKAA